MTKSELIKKELIYAKSQYSDICQQINQVKQLISNLIRDKKDNLFAKYLIYLKYYCGYTKNNKNDFTAK